MTQPLQNKTQLWNNLILSLFILSILDLEFTIYEIALGIAYEYNMFLARLINIGYLPFILTKTNLTLASCIIFHIFIHKPLTRGALVCLNCVYLCLFMYHIIGIYLYS